VVNVGGVVPATSVAWGAITGTLSSQTDLQNALDLKLDATTAASTYYLQTNPDGFIGDAPSDGSTYGRNNGAWAVVGGGGFITSVSSPLAVNSGDLSVDLSGYAALTGAVFSGTVTVGSFNPDPTPTSNGEIWYNALLGKLRFYDSASTKSVASEAWAISTFLQPSALTPYAPLAGATFTGKVNMAAPTAGSASLNLGVGTAPTTSVAGDIWIATNINYRDTAGTQKAVANTNTSNTYTAPQIIQTTVGTVNAALRITQLGTGNAITVEDSTSPDATPFVVDQHGKVGIGVAPDATAAIKIDGNGMSFNGLVFNPTATAAHTGGSDTLDLLVTINGTNYRLGLRPA
jgi:hypothetical protein